MKKIILVTALILILTTIYAQDYNTGIGIRGGLSNGLTVRHLISEQTALEGILSTRWGGLNLTGLIEFQNMAFSTERLNWYYGLGGHIGFWNGDNVDWKKDNDDYTVVGVDAILGLEYNFKNVPINLSIDWKPAFNLFGDDAFWGDGGALSIRYIF
jgi:hypothetical protein